MRRMLEGLAYGVMATSLLLATSALLIDRQALGAEQAPLSEQPIALASDTMAETIARWEAPPPAAPAPQELAAAQPEAPPVAPQIETHQPSEPALPVAAPQPAPAETSPQIALPPLRPAMTQALALPSEAPEIPSALLLQHSDRPTARPARPAPQPRRAEPQQQPAPRQRQAQPSQQPAPAARQQAAPAAPQGGSSAGAPATQARPQVNTGQLMSQWAGQLSSCLNRRVRAPSSLRGGGQVMLSLQIGRNGAIQGVGVARSSGNPALDQAAVTAASRVGRCPAAPRGLDAASYSFQLPINLR